MMAVSCARLPPHSWRTMAPVIESSEPTQKTGSEWRPMAVRKLLAGMRCMSRPSGDIITT